MLRLYGCKGAVGRHEDEIPTKQESVSQYM